MQRGREAERRCRSGGIEAQWQKDRKADGQKNKRAEEAEDQRPTRPEGQADRGKVEGRRANG